ncbi:anaphase-promoting complex subunit 10 isoform X2 [Topomyia yanbarensis]|uniref:anaphase-promoting complex subunit 10 isoform X2 n=1 Tax=Topomyia yanbarensis TaxID=2498891 RepID=UPI00273B3AB9|nr:anaphase-promoting complex subunit 10 isoform X2 [Topomyia yanbarensis]
MSVKTGANVCPTTEERSGNVREVGSQAVWSLSSCKPGFGVEQLRDNSMETYWQSDGQLPHLVNIQFPRKTTEVEVVDLCEPSGWVCIPIKEVRDIPMRTFMIQIAVISNHQNGRDTHMRQIRVHSPTEGTTYPLEQYGPFSTIEFQQFRTIR